MNNNIKLLDLCFKYNVTIGIDIQFKYNDKCHAQVLYIF